MERMGKEEEGEAVMKRLEQLIEERCSGRSADMGLLKIEQGRQKGTFNKPKEALELMQEGINILIAVRYKEPFKINTVYKQMAAFSRSLLDLDS